MSKIGYQAVNAAPAGPGPARCGRPPGSALPTPGARHRSRPVVEEAARPGGRPANGGQVLDPRRCFRAEGVLRLAAALLGPAALLAPSAATAGPPYLSDDPEPTDTGHWEIYNFATGTHTTGGLDGEAGVDLNYGALKDLQLTAVLPLGFSNARGFAFDGLRGGTGVIELAAKYRFLHQSEGSLLPDVSVFPRLFAPTSARFGPSRANLFLPVWAQKDWGPWSAFGGGGYQINPGPNQRNFWQGGVALSRAFRERYSLGVEVYGQGDDSRDGGRFAAINVAATAKLVEHWSLLVSAGPRWEDDGRPGQVFYLALKADY